MLRFLRLGRLLKRPCDFFDANGHSTIDYRHLKSIIEGLCRQGHLTKWIAQEWKKYREEKAQKAGEPTNKERPVCVG